MENVWIGCGDSFCIRPGDDRRIDAAGEERPERHVAPHAQPHGLGERRPQLLLPALGRPGGCRLWLWPFEPSSPAAPRQTAAPNSGAISRPPVFVHRPMRGGELVVALENTMRMRHVLIGEVQIDGGRVELARAPGNCSRAFSSLPKAAGPRPAGNRAAFCRSGRGRETAVSGGRPKWRRRTCRGGG